MSSSYTTSRKAGFLTRLLRTVDSAGQRLFSLGPWVLPLMALLCGFGGLLLVITPLTVRQQWIVSVTMMGFCWMLLRADKIQASKHGREALHLFIAWISIVTTLRYLYYRFNYTLNLDGWVTSFFSILLFAVELYAIMTLLLSYFQTLRLRDRTPIDLSTIPEQYWPEVDVYIPTYNEDVGIVRKTALGALAIDYPKKRVYVLDDGRAEKYRARRRQLRQMCEELGCTLLTRPNNDHAKAGNINTALRKTPGQLVLILDCDHIPTKKILRNTVGFFKDPKVALVQTPHWFFNPDPFERNLVTKGRVPVSNELFYKVVQKGNDFWNATFFCGSAAIVRKKPLLEVGGIAVETVTEDCHTAMRLHERGYKSLYYDKIMVAGLAPETFASYVGQQVRWARGMAQILRLENPLFKRSLKLPQRLCYFSATSHFFFGFPRLLYAVAPVLYLLFGINLIRGIGLETLAYALPHIVLAMFANHITFKSVRFSFWNEIFEYAIAFQCGFVTLAALINPSLGSFNVTDKGANIDKRVFDWRSSQITIFMAVLLVISLLTVPFWLVLRPDITEAVLMNAGWSIFNLILLVAALLVAYEQPQVRRTHRLLRQLEVVLQDPYNPSHTLSGQTVNISETGAQIAFPSLPNIPDQISLHITGDFGAEVQVTAKVHRVQKLSDQETRVTVEFIKMSRQQWDQLVLVLYSDVEEWYSQNRENSDNFLESLNFVLTALIRAFKDPKATQAMAVRKQVQAEAQIYWEGKFHPATVTAVSSSSIQLEMAGRGMPHADFVQQFHPPVGLSIPPRHSGDVPLKLLAQIKSVEPASPDHDMPWADDLIRVELALPQVLEEVQQEKVRHILAQI